MKLKLVTQKKIEKEEDGIKSLLIDTESGQIQILENHANLVSLLSVGIATIEKENGKKEELVVNGGILSVSNNLITVITDEVAIDSGLVESEILEAISKAKDKTLSSKTFENEDSRNRALAFMMAKMKLAKKKRK